MTQRWIEMTEGRLAYERHGEGPDLVFVHGWPLHSATFRHVVPALAKDFTCHLFDLPGTGKTEWRAARGDLVGHARIVREAIDSLGLEEYGLVSHDSGAAIARLVAADDRRVRGLVMGNTEIPGHRPWQVELYVAAVRVPGMVKMLTTLMRSSMVRRSSLGFGGCFDDATLLEPGGEFHELFVRPILEDPAVAEGQMGLLRGLDWSVIDGLADVHAQIQCPVRLVWGPHCPFFPAELAERMVDQFPGGADYVELPSGKVFAHEEHPLAFAAQTRELFRRCFDHVAAA